MNEARGYLNRQWVEHVKSGKPTPAPPAHDKHGKALHDLIHHNHAQRSTLPGYDYEGKALPTGVIALYRRRQATERTIIKGGAVGFTVLDDKHALQEEAPHRRSGNQETYT